MRERSFCRPGMTLLLAALIGCTNSDSGPSSGGLFSRAPGTAPSAPAAGPPSAVSGTVREFAVYDTAGAVPVQGYGLVDGLGHNGSSEVPENLRDYFVQYLAKRGFGSAQRGLRHIPPMKVLQDLDTAIVLVGGLIPFGAPAGAKFDIALIALPNTQTRSLQGGNLMPTDLRLYIGAAVPGGPTKVLAEGGGPVFVNPFVDPNDEGELVKWREGRVLGGGRVAYAHPIYLQLRQPDFVRSNLIATRIQGRFGTLSEKVANARDRSTIELTVPRAWRDDYQHFLELVMHVPLIPASRWELRARELVRLMEAPEAPCEEISLVLEAMGRNMAGLLRTLYASRNSPAAFYAARAASRLGEEGAEGVLIRFAQENNSPFQVPAIEELGRNDALVGATAVLQSLINDENNLVRIAAYEGLARRGDRTVVTRIRVEGQLTLDLVKSSRPYVIYATQTMESRIALFGADMPVSTPIFFSPSDELAIIRSLPGDSNLGVFRKMPNGRYTDVLPCSPNVQSLVLQLASIPDLTPEGQYHGLRLNYAEVLSILCRMCQRGDIPAKFNLQSDSPSWRIPGRGPTVGRPDVPGT